MFGRTLKVAAVLVITQLSAGCCCCYRPFFCHGCCGGCAPAPACGGCSSCYTPTVGTVGPVVAPFPGVSVAPTTVVPNMPPASSSAANPIAPFNSATYTHPIR